MRSHYSPWEDYQYFTQHPTPPSDLQVPGRRGLTQISIKDSSSSVPSQHITHLFLRTSPHHYNSSLQCATSTLLTIASASAATAAAVPVPTPNAVNIGASKLIPQVVQTTKARDYNSEIWYAGTMQSAETQPLKALVIETKKVYERVLEQTRKDAINNPPLFFCRFAIRTVSCTHFVWFVSRLG